MNQSGSGTENPERLFDLYFDRVYDLCLRLLNKPETAADTAEEAFRRALTPGVQPELPGLSFEARLFSAALDALEARAKPGFALASARDPVFHRIDQQKLSNANVTLALETAGVIWENLSRFDPADYVLLDLHLRQGINEDELATILKTKPAALRQRLVKLLKKTDEELSSLLIAKRGSRNCDAMRRAMLALPVAARRDQIRKVADKHVRSCQLCTGTKSTLPPPLQVFGAIATIATPVERREQALGGFAVLPASGAAAFDTALPPPTEETPVVTPPFLAPPPPVNAPPSLPMSAQPPVPPPQRVPPLPPPTISASSTAGGGFGPPIKIGEGVFGRWRRSLSNLRLSSLAVPVTAIILFGIAGGLIWGSGVCGFGPGGGSDPTPTPTATNTPVPTATKTPKPTATATEEPEPTATEEALPTEEPTIEPTAGATLTPTVGPTAAPTPTVEPTIEATPTVEPTAEGTPGEPTPLGG